VFGYSDKRVAVKALNTKNYLRWKNPPLAQKMTLHAKGYFSGLRPAIMLQLRMKLQTGKVYPDRKWIKDKVTTERRET
jgi:hypothetical protein